MKILNSCRGIRRSMMRYGTSFHTRRKSSFWVLAISLLFLVIIFAQACDLFRPLEDPADPNSSNFQGFTEVINLSDVIPMTPEGVQTFPPTLVSAKLIGGTAYRIQISSNNQFLNPEYSKEQSSNTFEPSDWIPSEGAGKYYFRVRAKKGDMWGPWSSGIAFTLTLTTTTTVPPTTSTTVSPWAIEMVEVTEGTFQVGSSSGEPDESPVHQVTVSSFLIGKYEITQSQYQEVTGNNPSTFTSGTDAPNRPVNQVTWYDAVTFCN